MEPNVELQRELTEATRDILARYDIYLRADDTFEVARQISPADIGPIPEPEPAPDPEPAPASPWFAGSGQDWVTAPPWVDVKEDTGGSSAPKNPRSSAKPGAAKKRHSNKALTGDIRTINRDDGVELTELRKEPITRTDDDVDDDADVEVNNGQTVELLKIENDFAFVRTSDGDEGYLRAEYLGPPSRAYEVAALDPVARARQERAATRARVREAALGQPRVHRRTHGGGKYKRKSKKKSKKRKSKKRKSKRKTKKR